jgi:hypothetical protein
MISKEEMHGQLLTEPIRFKVTLEVNVAGAGEELGSRVLRFDLWNGLSGCKDMRWKVKW